jgi:hypothetical protein
VGDRVNEEGESCRKKVKRRRETSEVPIRDPKTDRSTHELDSEAHTIRSACVTACEGGARDSDNASAGVFRRQRQSQTRGGRLGCNDWLGLAREYLVVDLGIRLR